MTVGLLVDVLLALSLVGLSLQVVTGRALFRDLVLFILYGLVIALSFARLGAPDIALAEAAIGAGLTGALMLMAYRRLVESRDGAAAEAVADEAAAEAVADEVAADEDGAAAHDRGAQDADAQADDARGLARSLRRRLLAVPVAVLSGMLVGIIGLSAQGVERPVDAAGTVVLQELPATGLGNPITAVLLIFRGLDTMLEMAVLLVALLGAWAVLGKTHPGRLHEVDRDTPLVSALLTIVVPLTLLIAVHLLLVGTDAPGGAFQAGAVLTGCGVLLVLTGTVRPRATAGLALRLLVIAGLAAFALIGVSPVPQGRAPMTLPGMWAVYLIETAMMLSIAVTMTLLFARSRGLEAESR